MYKFGIAAILVVGALAFVVKSSMAQEDGDELRLKAEHVKHAIERLNEEASALRAKHRELEKTDDEEARDQVAHEAERVERKLDELRRHRERLAQGGREHRERRGSRERRRSGRRDHSRPHHDDFPHEMRERKERIEHVRRASESLEHAGMEEMARDLAREAEGLEKELRREFERWRREQEHRRRREEHEEDGPGARAVLEAIEGLHNEIRELREEVRKLHELVEEK